MKVSHISDDFLPLLPCVESHSWCLSRPQTLLSPAQPNLSAHSSLRVCGIWVRCTGEPTTTPRWLPPCVGWAVLLLACCILTAIDRGPLSLCQLAFSLHVFSGETLHILWFCSPQIRVFKYECIWLFFSPTGMSWDIASSIAHAYPCLVRAQLSFSVPPEPCINSERRKKSPLCDPYSHRPLLKILRTKLLHQCIMMSCSKPFSSKGTKNIYDNECESTKKTDCNCIFHMISKSASSFKTCSLIEHGWNCQFHPYYFMF